MGPEGPQGIQGIQGEEGPPSLINITTVMAEGPIVTNGDFEDSSSWPDYILIGWKSQGHRGGGSGEYSLEGRYVGLCGDGGCTLEQQVLLYEHNLYFGFYYRPMPNGAPIWFRVYFDDIEVFHGTFDGPVGPWAEVRVHLLPLMDTLGYHTIKFVVLENSREHSVVLVDRVSIS